MPLCVLVRNAAGVRKACGGGQAKLLAGAHEGGEAAHLDAHALADDAVFLGVCLLVVLEFGAAFAEVGEAHLAGAVSDLVDALEGGEVEQMRKLFTSFLADIPYTMRRKENERERERYFHYTFYLIFRLVSVYTVYSEKQQSEGRVDCIVETPDYVYIFEFKLDGTADEALQQIEEKGYSRPYDTDSRKLYKIGAVFSSQTGTISDWKVKE